ncbi:hypothetical protein R1sor_022271 [Riccia sorocarpa]|uniref:Uncharacterized protein n=1 Tax=Riccia sorocarpa TaxID=122646 RepID=A0ABD3GMP7_9MARC
MEEEAAVMVAEPAVVVAVVAAVVVVAAAVAVVVRDTMVLIDRIDRWSRSFKFEDLSIQIYIANVQFDRYRDSVPAIQLILSLFLYTSA